MTIDSSDHSAVQDVEIVNDLPIRLVTYSKEKYLEQIVAIKRSEGTSNIRLFDAVLLFMEDDTWEGRKLATEEARLWAEKLVAQVNAGADALQNSG